MDIEKYHFGFIGFGHMAEIIYSFLVKARLISSSQTLFIRRDKDKQKEISHKYGITSSSLAHLVHQSDVLLFCVKPQNIAEVMATFPKIDLSHKFFISLLAGTRLSYFQKHLGEKTQLLRVMPNLPSAIGEGMSALCFAKGVEDRYIHLSRGLFSALGQIEEVSEEVMDTVTAISGSGPAFVASLIDATAKFGKKEGLSYEQALRLACQTFIGTAKVLQSGKKPNDLVKEIAVFGGTTQAGMKVLEERGLLAHLEHVLAATLKRAKELSE